MVTVARLTNASRVGLWAFASAGAALVLCACGTALGDSRSDSPSDETSVGVTGEPHAAWTYTKALPVLEEQPALWGGAYVGDDGWLVVKYVGQSAAEAQKSLSGSGVTGGYKLKLSTVSQAGLFQQLELVTKYASDHADSRITGTAPDYEKSAIVVFLHNDDGSTESALRALLTGTGPTPMFEAGSPASTGGR